MKHQFNELDLINLANDARKKWGIGLDNPINYETIPLLLDNLTIIDCPFSNELGGVILKDTDDNAIIAINSHLPLYKYYEVLAHELYHYYTKSFFSRAIPSNKELLKNEDDIKADLFAKYFLLPREPLMDFFVNQCGSKLDVFSLLKISLFFNVDYKIVKDFLNAEQIIIDVPDDFDIENELSKYGLSHTLYLPKRSDNEMHVFGRYCSLANKLLEDEKISQRRFEELLSYFGDK